MKIVKYYQESMKLHRNINRIMQQRSPHGDWLDGEIVTIHGIVSIQAQTGGSGAFTRFDFVHDGKLHIKTIQRYYSERGISMLAKKFAESIIKDYEKNIF